MTMINSIKELPAIGAKLLSMEFFSDSRVVWMKFDDQRMVAAHCEDEFVKNGELCYSGSLQKEPKLDRKVQI